MPFEEERDAGEAYSGDRPNEAPHGFRGRQVLKLNVEVGKMFSSSSESEHTLVAGFVECNEITLSLICISEIQSQLPTIFFFLFSNMNMLWNPPYF